jgi:hypothetical protein
LNRLAAPTDPTFRQRETLRKILGFCTVLLLALSWLNVKEGLPKKHRRDKTLQRLPIFGRSGIVS